MESIGHYLNLIKEWFKEGWKFLFEDTQRIKAHHLVGFLLTIIAIWLLSYVVEKVFKTVIKLLIMITLTWLVYMFLFDRSKYNELFNKKGSSESDTNNN